MQPRVLKNSVFGARAIVQRVEYLLALHEANLAPISGIPYGPPTKARSNPKHCWVWPKKPKPNKTKKKLVQLHNGKQLSQKKR